MDRAGVNQHATQDSTSEEEQPTDAQDPTGIAKQPSQERQQDDGCNDSDNCVKKNKNRIDKVWLWEGKKIDSGQEKEDQLPEKGWSAK